jgi:adenylate cyclase
MGKVVNEIISGLFVGLLAAAIILGADQLFTSINGEAGFNPLTTFELKTFDWRLSATARPETARKDIALVEIDETSLRDLQDNAGRWPWPRAVHMLLLDYLARAPAKVVAYDVNFAEPDTRRGFDFGGGTISGKESDDQLVESVRSSGNVILLSDATFLGNVADFPEIPDTGYRLDQPGIAERQTVLTPFATLAGAASGFGHNLFVLDTDGPIRHTVPFVRSKGRALASLGLAAAIRAAGLRPSDVTLDGTNLRLGDRVMPLSWRRVATSDGIDSYLWGLINFRGPAVLKDMTTLTYPTYSFSALEYSEEQILAGVKPKVDPSVFRDKIVFVGATAAGLFDVFETPFGHGKMPGIHIHAAVADDFLSNRFLTPSSMPVRAALVLASAIFVGVIATLLPAWWATTASVGFLLVMGWISMEVFGRGYWLNFSQPFLASTLALFGGVAYQYFVEGREKRKMKKLFGQYVSKDVYDSLVSNPELARLGGTRRDMTVLFSDIRGFTTVSERGEPEEIVRTLNEYFTRMVDLVFKHQGTLDKFVGDMVMALFGAPLEDPDHADHAVDCALEMIVELRKLNDGWREEGRPELDIGIGVNTGPMIAGNIGSEAIMSYTVIGDAVNLGSRLESANKQYGTRIIISEATREHLKNKYVFRPLGDIIVKGKTKPVAIFEVLGREGEDPVGVPISTAVKKDSPVTTVTNVTKEVSA